jgi:ATP-binding cassette subfamily F protein 3
MTPLLQVKNLSKQYSSRTIFSGLSFGVIDRQKIGVIGRNGAGKSTLFRIVLKQETADEGQIIVNRDTIIGHIEQESYFLTNETGLAFLERISGQPDWQCQKIASRFRFTADQLNRPAEELSGGWQMRLRLSAMLLGEPNLFLLDEPTNYLDLGTILLLEDFLKSYRGSFLIISHDREFLKNTCHETLEITPHRCIDFPQGIEAYLAYKEQRLNTDQKLNKKIEREQKHLQDFIDRFRYKASKAGQAQAFIQKIDKLQAHKISIEHSASTVSITLPLIEKKKNTVLTVDHLTIGYNGRKVVTDLDFIVKSGEKILITGDNGQGKSTLLKTLAGEIEPLAGRYNWFAGLKLAYYAQQSMADLNQNEQVGDYLRRYASSDIKTEKVLQLAGDFLFRDDDLKKPIGVLSGGEKSRLILAGLLLGKPDVLILDEPTNHLDFETVEALGEALSGYNGTLIFTSHDRTFANLVADGLIELNQGSAKRYYHGYEDYVQQLEKRLAIQIETTPEITTKPNIYLEQKELQKKIKSLENQLIKLEADHERLFKYFLDNPLDYSPSKKEELAETERLIKETEEAWLELAA